MDNNNGMFQVPSTTITTASLRMLPQRPSLATNYNAAFTLHATTAAMQCCCKIVPHLSAWIFIRHSKAKINHTWDFVECRELPQQNRG